MSREKDKLLDDLAYLFSGPNNVLASQGYVCIDAADFLQVVEQSEWFKQKNPVDCCSTKYGVEALDEFFKVKNNYDWVTHIEGASISMKGIAKDCGDSSYLFGEGMEKLNDAFSDDDKPCTYTMPDALRAELNKIKPKNF